MAGPAQPWPAGQRAVDLQLGDPAVARAQSHAAGHQNGVTVLLALLEQGPALVWVACDGTPCKVADQLLALQLSRPASQLLRPAKKGATGTNKAWSVISHLVDACCMDPLAGKLEKQEASG